MRLLAWHEIPCVAGSTDAFAQSLRQLRQALPGPQPVVLGIPSSAALMTTVEPLVVRQRRALLALRFELQQFLPFDVDQAAWHHQWLNGHQQASARRLSLPIRKPKRSGARPAPATRIPQPHRAIVVAIHRARLDERLTACRRAGLAVRAVTVNPLAALQVVQDGPLRAADHVLLHLGEQQAEWILWSAARAQVVPLGTDVSAASAEELHEAISRSWNALREESGQALSHVAQLWLFGAHAELAAVESKLPGTLGLTVGRLDPRRKVSIEAAVAQAPERACVAVGLALQGLGSVPAPINLLAQAQRRAATERTARIASAFAAACAVVLFINGAIGMFTVRHRYAKALTQLQQREQTYQVLRTELRTLLKQQMELERRTQQFQGLVAGRAAVEDVLSRVVGAMPDDVWLTKLTLSKDGLIEGTLEGQGKSFQSVTQFIDRLKGEADMTTVQPLSTQVKAEGPAGAEVVAFSIVIERAAEPSANPALAVVHKPTRPGAGGEP